VSLPNRENEKNIFLELCRQSSATDFVDFATSSSLAGVAQVLAEWNAHHLPTAICLGCLGGIFFQGINPRYNMTQHASSTAPYM